MNTIGQSKFRSTTTKSGVELEFTWTQPIPGERGKDFKSIIGRCPEFENIFPLSKVRLGGQNERPLVFEPTDEDIVLKSGVEYAGLVKLAGDSSIEVICVADAIEFDTALAALKAANQVTAAVVKKASLSKDALVTPVETFTPGTFRVTVPLRKRTLSARGNLMDIIIDLATQLGNDPVPLLDGENVRWELKGQDDRYIPAIRPAKIPAAPAMLLTTLAKLSAAAGGNAS